MLLFFTALQFIIVALLVIIVLLQSSSAGDVTNFTSGYSNVFSAKGAANFLTKFTWVLVALFFLNTMLLSKLYGAGQHSLVVDKIESSIEKLEKTIEKNEAKKGKNNPATNEEVNDAERTNK